MDRADDLERLRLFRLQGDHLLESSIIKGRVGASLNIRWEAGGPVTWTTRQPGAEPLEALVLRLRPFLAPNGIGIYPTHNVCQARLEHAEMRAFLATTRSDWNLAQRHGVIGLKIDEQDYRPDRVADLMIDVYFHPENAEAQAEYARLVGPGQILTRHVFIDYIFRAVETVFSTHDVIRIGLDRDMFH
jgi:hypothetical protein